MRRLITILGVSLLALASAGSALAQVATTGTIQIILEDAQGGRLPGVTVTASAPDVVTTRTAVSDAEGVATLEALAPSAKYIDQGLADRLPRSHAGRHPRAQRSDDDAARADGAVDRHRAGHGDRLDPGVVDVTRAITGTGHHAAAHRVAADGPVLSELSAACARRHARQPDAAWPGNPSSRSGDELEGRTQRRPTTSAARPTTSTTSKAINVTDPVTGTFGANLNTEIIQEQKVITGGIPAEYVGAAGLISTVITKSGSNRYSGSANYFFQNDNFVAENEHTPGATFSTDDTAFTIGGPVVKDKLWGFGSFRYTNGHRGRESRRTPACCPAGGRDDGRSRASPRARGRPAVRATCSASRS